MNKIVVLTLLFILITGTLTTTLNSTSATSTIDDNSWHTKKPMSQARSRLGVVAVDGKIYAIGGFASGGVVGTNERYDPKTDTWVTLKPMPTPGMDFGIVVYEDKIYCIGGATYFDSPTSRVSVNEVYDIATDSWSTKTPLPFAAKDTHAHVVDGKIFVTAREASLMGSDFKDSDDWVEYLVANGRKPFDAYPDYFYIYDPVTDLWSQKNSMPLTPMAGNFIVSAVVDGKIFFAGEFDGGSGRLWSKVLIYDPQSDLWSEGAIGFMRLWCGHAGVTSGVYAPKSIYALGISSNNVYDPENNVWSSAQVMPTERSSFGVAVVNDVLYVIGGYTSTNFYSIGDSSYGSNNTPSALNEQYIPLDYHGTLPSEQKPEFSLTQSTVAIIVLIISIAVTTFLFLYLRGRTRIRGVKYE